MTTTLSVGSGQTYTTIQSALDALPATLDDNYVISIRSGSYPEELNFPTITAGAFSLTITGYQTDIVNVKRFGEIRCSNTTIRKLHFSITPDTAYTIRSLGEYDNVTIEKCFFTTSNSYIIKNHDQAFRMPVPGDETAIGTLADSRQNISDNMFDPDYSGVNNVIIRNNVFNHNSSDPILYGNKSEEVLQNTVYMPSLSEGFVNVEGTNPIIRNNIFHVTGSGDYKMLQYPTGTWNNNDWYYPNANSTYWVTTGQDLSWWTTNYESSALNVNPSYIDEGNDFNINFGSPLKDAGYATGVTDDILGTLRPQNLLYDVGAYEVNDSSFPYLCWSFTAKYKYSNKLYHLTGPGDFPKALKIPDTVDTSTGVMIEDGIEIERSKYLIS